MTVRISLRHFIGSKKVFSREPEGLAAILRGVAADNARLRLKTLALTALTDNTTGVSSGAPYTVVDTAIPTAAFNATAANGATLTVLNTAITNINNAHAVLGTALNLALSPLGLTPITGLATGVVTTANTIPALTKTVTTSSGVAAADYATARAQMLIAKNNHQKLLRAMQLLLVGLNDTAIVSSMLGNYSQDFVLNAPGAAVASATGASALAATDANAFLTAMANNMATLAATWNAALTDAAAGTRPLSVVAI